MEDLSEYIQFLESQKVYSVGFSLKIPKDFDLNFSNISEVLIEIKESKMLKINLLFPKEIEQLNSNKCHTEGNTLMIDCKGNFFPCPVSGFQIGNINEIEKIIDISSFFNYGNFNLEMNCESFPEKCPSSL